MLGTELSILLEKSGMEFIGTDKETDITNPISLRSFASSKPIKWIINCAAYTAVDKAENDEYSCRLLNTTGAANVAAVACAIGAILIHISTDYVFDGNANQPYTEDHPSSPIGVYGVTKRDGEINVLQENPSSYIIRTAWLYGMYGNNFVLTMLRLLNENDQISVVDDQRGSPTWSYDLSSAILMIIRTGENNKNIPFGIYNYTNEGNITWYDFAKEIYFRAQEIGYITKDCLLKSCDSNEYPSIVKRPAYSVLNKAKIKKALGIYIPLWNESLQNFLHSYSNNQA